MGCWRFWGWDGDMAIGKEASWKPACNVGFTDGRRFGNGEMDDFMQACIRFSLYPSHTIRETLVRLGQWKQSLVQFHVQNP